MEPDSEVEVLVVLNGIFEQFDGAVDAERVLERINAAVLICHSHVDVVEDIVLEVDGAERARKATILEADVRVGSVPTRILEGQCSLTPAAVAIILRRKLGMVGLAGSKRLPTGVEE
jgi:hypothetical protein